MPETQVTNITEDIVRVNIAGLSYWSLIEICTNSALLKFWYLERNDCYVDDNFSDRQKYFELTDLLLRSAQQFNLPELVPLGRLVQLEFLIPTGDWLQLVHKWSHSNSYELKNIAEKIILESTTIKHKNEPISNSVTPQMDSSGDINLIDLDHSIENKIIFYHLLQSKSETIAKISEKIDLMTLEQKENYIEQICQRETAYKIPKIIFTKPFCTLKIKTALFDLIPLFTTGKFSLIIRQPNFQNLKDTSNRLNETKHYPEVIKILDRIKAHFEKTHNHYVLPLGVKQTALLDLDLQGFFELSKINNPFTLKIIELIHKEVPFTKGIINE